MVDKMKKAFITVLILTLLVSLLPITSATATDYGLISFDTTYTGQITRDNTSDRYMFTITQPGRVTATLTKLGLSDGVSSVYTGWLDSLGANILFHGSDLVLPQVRSIDLEAGTYYFEVSRWGSSRGTYNISFDFVAPDITRTSPHNTIGLAKTLISGQTVTGFISMQNDTDMYKIELSHAGSLMVDLDYDPNLGVRNISGLILYDNTGRNVHIYRMLDGISYPEPPYSKSLDLDAGVYYIRVQTNVKIMAAAVDVAGRSSGTYILTATFPSAQSQRPDQYTITAASSPPNGGMVSGSGTYNENASVTLQTTPNSDFTFDGWYENGTRVDPNVTYTFTATASRTLAARFTNTGGQAVVESNFKNPHSEWAREELGRAFAEDLVPPLLLDPNVDLREPITRVEFAGVVVKTFENLSGARVQPAAVNPFTDTTDIYARMAYDAGLMVGVSSTSFASEMILNRETAATALTRVFKKWYYPGWTFATDDSYPLNYSSPALFLDDANISGWAWDSVYFMAANGIIQGFPDNTFRARNLADDPYGYANATREQALIITLRMVENLK